MAKYFKNTFERSNFVLAPEQLTYLEENHLGELHYGSAVSWQLVTKINERQIMVGLFVVFWGLAVCLLVFWAEGNLEI